MISSLCHIPAIFEEKRAKTPISGFLILFIFIFLSTNIIAQISIPNAAFTDAQDFNTLASTGTSTTVPAGWAFVEAGANQNALYAASPGSSNAGDTYSFGPAADSERALGGLQSGSLIPTYGVCYTNNTGGIITGFTITYTGETWRVGTANRTDGITFQYNQNTTGISGTGTWTSFPALDYFNPGQSTGSGTLQHSAPITSMIAGLSIQPGHTFCFRWNDFNATGSDDGIGVDDYSLTNLVVEPAAVATVNLSVSSTTASEASPTDITVTVTSSAAVSADETVTLIVSGTNITTGDYTLNAMTQNAVTIAIPTGMTMGTATFRVNDDTAMESLETAVLTISNPSAGLVLGTTTSQMIHIEDNDIVNTATLYNRAYLKNNGLITVQGKPYINTGKVDGKGTFIGSFVNNGGLSPGNN